MSFTNFRKRLQQSLYVSVGVAIACAHAWHGSLALAQSDPARVRLVNATEEGPAPRSGLADSINTRMPVMSSPATDMLEKYNSGKSPFGPASPASFRQQQLQLPSGLPFDQNTQSGAAPQANGAGQQPRHAAQPPAVQPPQAKAPQAKPPANRRLINRASFLRQIPGGDNLQMPESTPETDAKLRNLISDIVDPEIPLQMDPQRSKLFRGKRPITRVSITNPDILRFTQYSPTEFELVAQQPGQTTMTIWFEVEEGEVDVLRYLVKIGPDETEENRRKFVYGELQKRINELFPNSVVQLIPVGASLIVRGQARDGEEASNIISMLSGANVNQLGEELGPGSFADVGTAERPFLGIEDLPASNIVNLLQVPGEQLIMLKVRVAELSRSANRAIGTDLTINAGDFTWDSMLGIPGAFSAVLDTDELRLAIQAISGNGYSKILAEPNLVTLNGRPATFFSGGSFAVPTLVGIGGIGARTAGFQRFGTQLFFVPTMIDKDRIRLQVAPTVSARDNNAAVGGIPGLNSRSVFTTVDLREGQWMALAGLLNDQQNGAKTGVPLLKDIPIFGTLFSRNSVERKEAELVILVSPEFVHPLEAEEVPMILPGMEVTEPGDWDLFLLGRYEGRPNAHHRSTIFPIYRDRVNQAIWQAHRAAKGHVQYQESEAYYIQGEHGFSN